MQCGLKVQEISSTFRKSPKIKSLTSVQSFYLHKQIQCQHSRQGFHQIVFQRAKRPSHVAKKWCLQSYYCKATWCKLCIQFRYMELTVPSFEQMIASDNGLTSALANASLLFLAEQVRSNYYSSSPIPPALQAHQTLQEQHQKTGSERVY